MKNIDIQSPVGRLVAERPARSRVFERHGIDYCCGGKRTLQQACQAKAIDPAVVLAELAALEAHDSSNGPNPSDMTMTELTDHIESTHHAYLRRELPRVRDLLDKVIAAHGSKYAWLAEVAATYSDLVAELEPHMQKEEQILFPMLRQLDSLGDPTAFQGGSVDGPIAVMEQEHDNAALALARLRELTGGFTPPDGACNTFRAMLEGLRALERDTHQHIHKENNVLFARAAEAGQS